MTILICDDLTPALEHLRHRFERTDKPCPAVVVIVGDYCDLVQESADRLVAQIHELDTSLRALVLDPPPEYGEHCPGLITPRIVDNADRSGANLSKWVNDKNGPARDTNNKSAPGKKYNQTPGAFF